MIELFGNKREPRRDLAQSDEPAQSVTITEASALSIYRPPIEPGSQILELDDLRRALDDAPELARINKPAPIDWMEGTPLSTAAAPPRYRRFLLPSAAVAVAGIVGLVVMLALASSGDRPPAAPATHESASSIREAEPIPADVAVPQDPVETADEGVEVDTPHERLATAVAVANWGTAVQLCMTSTFEDAEDGERCGIAACNVANRDLALKYRRILSRPGQLVIETECRSRGISLVEAPVVRGKKPNNDPCKDPKYVEAHPLRCQ
jgi:hypothetical protein